MPLSGRTFHSQNQPDSPGTTPRHGRRFTLIELLVVIAIITTL
ncbi:type II secretion system protein [uncultured Victivallis sp.]